MASSTLITVYIASGIAANRPTTPAVPSGGSSIYYATDTGVTSIWNSVSSAWTNITGTITSAFNINPAGITFPTAGSPLLNVGQSGGTAFIQEVSYGSSTGYLGYSAGGTFSAPTALSNNSTIAQFAAFGYNGAAFVECGSMFFHTSQAWSGSAQGTSLQISVTKNGAVSQSTAFQIDQSYAQIQTTVTVTNLPSGLAAGSRHFVSDSTLAGSGNFGAIVAGSGTNAVPVYYDGTNWRIG